LIVHSRWRSNLHVLECKAIEWKPEVTEKEFLPPRAIVIKVVLPLRDKENLVLLGNVKSRFYCYHDLTPSPSTGGIYVSIQVVLGAVRGILVRVSARAVDVSEGLNRIVGGFGVLGLVVFGFALFHSLYSLTSGVFKSLPLGWPSPLKWGPVER
jgi:hypothetical protein